MTQVLQGPVQKLVGLLQVLAAVLGLGAGERVAEVGGGESEPGQEGAAGRRLAGLIRDPLGRVAGLRDDLDQPHDLQGERRQGERRARPNGPEAEPPGTHRSSDLGAKHLLVLAVLSFQGIHVALHLERRVSHHPLPWRQVAAPLAGRQVPAGLPVGQDVVRLQKQLLAWTGNAETQRVA